MSLDDKEKGGAPDALAHLAKVLTKVFDGVQRFAEGAAPILEKSARAFANWWEELPQKLQAGLASLANHGWYIAGDMPFQSILEFEHVDDDEWPEIDQFLVAFWQARIQECKESLCARHPARKAVLEAAFAAHSRGDFLLSIPVMLAQVDGITAEACGESLFSKVNRGKNTAPSKVLQGRDAFERAYLQPITDVFPIVHSSEQRQLYGSELNRHAVMHGEDVDYGTETNACKAVSLLTYMSWMLAALHEQGAIPVKGRSGVQRQGGTA